MEPIKRADLDPDIDRCRELLGDEAMGLSDEQVDRIRQHAETVAHALIDVFMEDRSAVR